MIAFTVAAAVFSGLALLVTWAVILDDLRAKVGPGPAPEGGPRKPVK